MFMLFMFLDDASAWPPAPDSPDWQIAHHTFNNMRNATFGENSGLEKYARRRPQPCDVGVETQEKTPASAGVA
jgi:hypothetical protein